MPLDHEFQPFYDKRPMVLRLAGTEVDPQAAALEHERVQQTTTFEAIADRFLAEYGKQYWRPGT